MSSYIHKILGEGAVADLCLWKDKINSGITFAIATLLWFLLEIMESRLIPILTTVFFLLMIILFLWSRFGQLVFTRRPPSPEEIKLPESSIQSLVSNIEGLLRKLYGIAYGKDMTTFFWTIFYLAIIDTIGSFINFLTILYIGLVSLMTLPALYLQFQEVIDSFIKMVSEEMSKFYAVFKSTVLDKIPRAAKVE